MTRTCYVNGRYVSARHAEVPIWDRGYQFADGAYEVIVYFNRRFLDEELHLKRLHYSLEALRIAPPMADAALKRVLREMVERHPFDDGVIYLQVTRGIAPRYHPFPLGAKPSLTMAALRLKEPSRAEVENGVAVIACADQRWTRRDIKSIALLPNVLARQQAAERGAREAILLDGQGMVTEATHSSFYIVKKNRIVTHPVNFCILNGIRRQVLAELAKEHRMFLDERPFSLEEARSADEAFLTSATAHVLPVTRLDDAPIGSGQPGPVALRLLALYREHVTRQTGREWKD